MRAVDQPVLTRSAPIVFFLNLLFFLPLLVLSGCYSPNPILEIAISPDGRHAAILREDGRLGTTALNRDDRFHLLTNAARHRVAWSPDSKRVAWVEQADGEPMALCL